MEVQEKRMFELFMQQFQYCWSCGVDPRSARFWGGYTAGIEYPRPLENHHIVGASGRRHVRPNLARLCKLCHDLYHGARVRQHEILIPQLSFENLLWLKREFDPRHYDPKLLCELKHRASIPEPEQPPSWHVSEFRHRHGHYPSERKQKSDQEV